MFPFPVIPDNAHFSFGHAMSKIEVLNLSFPFATLMYNGIHVGNVGYTCQNGIIVEHGSDPRFPRARASEYSTERGQAYLLSSEWVQELPCRYGRHIRLVNSNEVNGSFETMSKLSESSESNRG